MYSHAVFKEKFDHELLKYILVREKLFKEKLKPFPNDYEAIWEYTKKLVSSGKRLRPYVCYLSYDACGGKKFSDIVGILVSLELLHLSFLVHDDIMDEGKVRHGVATAHEYFAKNISRNIQKNKKQFGISRGLLLGDFLFYWSADIFDKSSRVFSVERRDKARNYYLDMVGETMLGQAIDIELTIKKTASEKDIYIKNYFKTANYTFIRPLQIGATLAGKDGHLKKFFESFGTSSGIAFQMQDDLLDILGTKKSLNKDLFTDLREGQHTIFTQYIFDKGTKEEKKLLRYFWKKKDIKARQHKTIQNLFIRSGAISYGTGLIEHYIRHAYEKIKAFSGNTKVKMKNFQSLLDLITKRVS